MFSKSLSFVSLFGLFSDYVSGVLLTPANPSTSFAEISLISDDDNSEVGGAYRCNVGADFDELCVELELDIDFPPCLGKEIYSVVVDVDRVSGDTDMMALLSYERESGIFDYVGILNDYDGFVNSGVSGGQTGGVLISPPCGSSSLYTFTGSNIANAFLDNVGNNAASLRQSLADGDGTDYEQLSADIINGNGPITYTIINDRVSNTLTIEFETQSTGLLSCTYDTAFAGEGTEYTLVFSPDDGVADFNSFDVNRECRLPTDEPSNEPTEEPTAEPAPLP